MTPEFAATPASDTRSPPTRCAPAASSRATDQRERQRQHDEQRHSSKRWNVTNSSTNTIQQRERHDVCEEPRRRALEVLNCPGPRDRVARRRFDLRDHLALHLVQPRAAGRGRAGRRTPTGQARVLGFEHRRAVKLITSATSARRISRRARSGSAAGAASRRSRGTARITHVDQGSGAGLDRLADVVAADGPPPPARPSRWEPKRAARSRSIFTSVAAPAGQTLRERGGDAGHGLHHARSRP